MRSFSRLPHFLIILSMIMIFTAFSAFATDNSFVTKILVHEGKVICFDLPSEFVPVTGMGETAVGIFIERIDEGTGRVEVRKRIEYCNILREHREQILERLKQGVYVFLLRDKQKRWNIIAVGTVVGAGLEYCNDITKQVDLYPSIISSTPAVGSAVVDKNEKAQAGGSGPVLEEIIKEQKSIIIVTSSPLPSGGEGSAYSVTLQAVNGTLPYIWGIIDGSLPGGLSLSSDGVISGTIASGTEGTYTFTVQVQDAEGNTASKIFQLEVTFVGSGYYYVHPVHGDDGDDGSLEKPWKTITHALAEAPKDTSKSTTIYLVSGTYGTSAAGYNGESFPLNMINGFTLQGVAATEGSSIIDGTSGGNSGIILCDGISAKISNITVQNGAGNGVDRAGGVTIANSTVTFDACTINNNQSSGSGGGLLIDNSTVTFNGCSITNNTATDNGGGINCRNSTVTINTCPDISGNRVTGTPTTGHGGAISSDSSTITINGATFDNNRAIFYGGAIDCDGTGGVLNVNSAIFTNNDATGANSEGGAIALRSTAGAATIRESIFNTNSATNDGGGAIEVDVVGFSPDSFSIISCAIKNSTGCGIKREDGASRPIVQGCRFFNNTRTTAGATAFDHYYTVGELPSYYGAGGGGLPDVDDEFPASFSGNGEGGAADPPITGRVYDSVTGETIPSPTIIICNASTNAQIATTTNNPFSFNVDPGRYYISVNKSGYGFPSQIKEGVTDGDHGDIFTASADPLTINIPMDPDGWLYVQKSCSKKRAEAGDVITYRITVQNKNWYRTVENVELVDELVNGFKYVSSPSFNLGTVNANSTQTITYQVRVGSGIPPGRYKSSCYTRKSTTGSRNSNIDSAEIEVIENPLFTKGTIIGKVFLDVNGNGVQDPEEPGIPRVSIYTEYGVVVETDNDGKYHIKDVPAGNHLLKIDDNGLPSGLVFTTDNPYYVKITEGLLAKVNFGIKADTRYPIPDTRKTNQFFIVALGEGIVRNLDTSGNIEMVEKDDRYDDGLTVDGRLALYLKGKILGKYLIKASIDTDRRTGKRSDRRTLFTNLDPDKYYPVYGDASKADYSGVDTQDIVYVIIEWDESFAKWGSFHTELPLYNRTLCGGIINYQSIGKTKFGDTRTKIKGFGAFSRQKPAHDEFVGTGGSLYYLRHDDIIEGSEKIKVEVRDRIGKIVTNSIQLVEEKDYEIDYDRGRILLKRPLNSVQQTYNNSIVSNDILMGERVYLVVDYEYYGDGLSDQAYGVNVSSWLGNYIRVGGTYVEEQKEGDPYKLMGGDGTLRINKDTEVNVNYSRTEETQLGSTISYDGGLTFSEQGEQYSLDKSGSAVSVDGRTKLFNNTDVFLLYSRQDPYYSVTNSITSQGSQKYMGNIITKLTENLSFGLTHLTQKYFEGSIAGTVFGATDSHTTTGILDYRPGKWDIRTEYQHQEVKNPITDYTYFGTLPLLDNDFIAGRIGYQLFSWLHPYVRGQVTVNGEANDQGTAGVDLNIGRNTTINLAETVGTLGDSTLVGLTTKITEDSDVYANLEVGNHTRLGKYTKTTYGQSTQLAPDSKAYVETDYSSYRENVVRGNILGYNKKITDTLGLGLTYERSNVKNNVTAIDRDAGAVSLTYLNPDWLKAYSKLEVRNDIGTSEIRQWVTQNDLLWRTTEWLELSGRCNWGWTNNEDTDTDMAEFYEVGAGFSLRPVTWDKINILGKYSYITDFPPDSQWDFPLDIESIKNVYSIEGIYDLFKYLSLVGKFSYRDMSEKVGTYDWVDSDTYLYIARTNFHIGEKGDCPLKRGGQSPFSSFLLRGWDFAVEYRILANDQIEDEKEGFLVELDKDLGNYIRCGVGYNFTEYDDDLRNDDNWDSKGWFFKLAGKY